GRSVAPGGHRDGRSECVVSIDGRSAQQTSGFLPGTDADADMKAKAQIKKQKSAVNSGEQTLSTEAATPEISWLQSSDFFRISNFALRISAESTPLKEFNSEF